MRHELEANAWQRATVLGVPFDTVDYKQVVDWIERASERNEHGYICVGAVHMLMMCREDPELKRAVLGASLCVPDGQPIVWAINALGYNLTERVYGPELMARHCERAALSGRKVFLYGGRDSTRLKLLEQGLLARYPKLKIVGSHSPPHRPLSDEELVDLIDEIDGSGAEVVWVGIGAPKQEKWMATMRPKLKAPVLVGVGAAFDFHAGTVPQAPAWMGKLALEWAYRLVREPRRLWRRYLKYNPLFVICFFKQYLKLKQTDRNSKAAN